MVQNASSTRGITHFLLWGLIVAVAAAAIWPREAYASSTNRVVVSLGDSYSSGEGCPPFYGQGDAAEWGEVVEQLLDENSYPFLDGGTGGGDAADKYDIEDWCAHRSRQSWPGLLEVGGVTLSDAKRSGVERKASEDVSWYFYACSGAEAHHVYQDDYEKAGVRADTGKKFSTTVEQQIAEAKSDIVSDLGEGGLDEVDYVTITIGGNDIGFSKIVSEVAVRNAFIDRDYLFNAMNVAWKQFYGREAYDKTKGSWLLFVKGDDADYTGSDDPRLRCNQIRRCYSEICAAFPSAQVIVAGYPTLLDDDGFEKVLARSEKAGLWNRFLTWTGLYEDNVGSVVGFSSWEGWFVNQNARKFNRALQGLVDAENMDAGDSSIHFVSVEDAFDGHEANVEDKRKRFLNSIMTAQSEDFEQLAIGPFEPSVGISEKSYLRSPISSYSLHPNYKGEAGSTDVSEKPHDGISCYRIAVQGMLDKLEDERPPVANEAPADLLKKYQDSLDIKNYSVDYLWQMMTYPITTYRWVIGDGIPDGAALGSELRDFDGDKEDEILVVRWTGGSYAVEMVEAAGGELVTVPLEADLRPQQVIEYPTDAYQMSSPILGAGCIDVCCDENDAVIVQSWYHTSPFSDGHEWLLDRFEYRGKDEGFVRVGRASMAGTGLGPMELQELIGQVKETGASTSALEGLSEQDAWQFNTLMLSDRDASIQLVARMEANSDAYGTDSYERQREIYNETHEDWCDPQLLGTFETTSSLGKPTDKAEEAADASSSVSSARTILSATLDELKERAQVSNEFFDYSGLQYQFVDLDDDGVDELFVSYLSGSWSETTSLIYKAQGDEAVRIFEYVRRGCGFVRCYPQTQTVVFQMVYKAMVYTWHYQYEDGAMVQRACELDGSNYNGTLGYETSEGHEVAEDEYRSAVEELAVGNAIDLTLESVW